MSQRGRRLCRLYKNGNGLLLGVPSDLRHQMKLRRGDLFVVSTLGDSLIYTPIGDAINARIGAEMTLIEKAVAAVNQ